MTGGRKSHEVALLQRVQREGDSPTTTLTRCADAREIAREIAEAAILGPYPDRLTADRTFSSLNNRAVQLAGEV